MFKRLDGRTIHTHQYSTTEYFTAHRAGDLLTPILSVSYDFSPVSVVIEQRRRPLLHFLTRTCAVRGEALLLCLCLHESRCLAGYMRSRRRSTESPRLASGDVLG